MSAPDFLVHGATDNVGVVVVETVQAGNQLTGWIMDSDETITIQALDDIPLGHKVALRALQVDDTVIKYGHDIGKVVAPIEAGGHLHVQNCKTKRW